MQCRQLLSLWKIVSDKQSIMRPLSIGRTKEQRCFWSFKKIAESYQGWLVCSESAMCLHLFQPCSLVAVASSPWCESTCKKKYWWKKKRNVLLCMITTASSKYDHDDFFSPHHCRSLSLSHFPSSVSSSFFSAFLFSLSFSLASSLFSCPLLLALRVSLLPSFTSTSRHQEERSLFYFKAEANSKTSVVPLPTPPEQPSSSF